MIQSIFAGFADVDPGLTLRRGGGHLGSIPGGAIGRNAPNAVLFADGDAFEGLIGGYVAPTRAFRAR